MIIYILMLILSMIFSIISKKYKNNKRIYIALAICSAIPFGLVTAIRYDVGTDYLYRYVCDFNMLKNGFEVNNVEPGFMLINKLAIIFNNYQIIFFITAVIITFFIFYTIYRDSKNITLSIFIFFAGAFFFQSLNMVRQYIAVALIFYSYKYVLNKKWIKFAIISILAIMFHTTSIVSIILIVFLNILNKNEKKNVLQNEKIIIISVFMLILFEPLIKYLINFALSYTRFKTYIGSKFDYGDLQIIPLITNMFMYIFMIIVNKKYDCTNDDKEKNITNFFLSMQGFALIFIALGKTSVLSIRLVYFFSIFQLISIPYFLNKIKLNLFKNYIIYTILIVSIFATSLTWTHILHPSDEVLPYKTIYNKDFQFR